MKEIKKELKKLITNFTKEEEIIKKIDEKNEKYMIQFDDFISNIKTEDEMTEFQNSVLEVTNLIIKFNDKVRYNISEVIGLRKKIEDMKIEHYIDIKHYIDYMDLKYDLKEFENKLFSIQNTNAIDLMTNTNTISLINIFYEINNAKRDLKNQITEVTILKTPLNRQIEKVEELGNDLAEQTAKIEGLSNSLTQQTKEVEELNTNLNKEIKKVEEIEKDLKDHDKNILGRMSMYFAIFVMIAGNISIMFKSSDSLNIVYFCSLILIINSILILSISVIFRLTLENKKANNIIIGAIIGMLLGIIIFYAGTGFTKDDLFLKKQIQTQMVTETKSIDDRFYKTNEKITINNDELKNEIGKLRKIIEEQNKKIVELEKNK